MSDPSKRPESRLPRPGPGEPGGRRQASPLLWLIVLLAMLAFGWYVYNQRGAMEAPANLDPPPPATTDAMTPRPAEGPEREPVKADAGATRGGTA